MKWSVICLKKLCRSSIKRKLWRVTEKKKGGGEGVRDGCVVYVFFFWAVFMAIEQARVEAGVARVGNLAEEGDDVVRGNRGGRRRNGNGLGKLETHGLDCF